MIARLRLLLLMARFRVAVTMWTFLLLGVAAHGTPQLGLHVAAASIALVASYAVATSLNDMADIEIDLVNRPRDASRPLVAGTATSDDLRRTAWLGTGMALATAAPLGLLGLCAVSLSLLLAYAYSSGPVRLSRRMTLAPIALTIAYVLVPYALGIVVAKGHVDGRDPILVGGLMVLFFARIVLKDFRDRLGDEAFGKPTLLFRLGKPALCRLSIAGAILGGFIAVGAVEPSGTVTALLVLDVAGVVWMLGRLRHLTDPRLEQIAIGTAAKAGNALLIGILAWLLLRGQGVPASQADLLELALCAVFAVSFIGLARHPERVRIGYKA